MKRIVALLLAFSMLVTLGLSTFAADTQTKIEGNTATTAEQTGSADVYTTTTDADEWWTIQIPADKSIPWGETTTVDMGYKVASQLKEGSQIKVTVTAGSEKLVQQNSGDTHAEITCSKTGLGTAATYGAANGSGDVENPVYDDYSSTVKIGVEADAFQGKPIDKYSVTLTYTVEVTAPAGD